MDRDGHMRAEWPLPEINIRRTSDYEARNNYIIWIIMAMRGHMVVTTIFVVFHCAEMAGETILLPTIT